MKSIRKSNFGTVSDLSLSITQEEIEKYIDNQRLGLLTLKCKYVYPSWTLLHYGEQLVQTSLKIQSLFTLLDYFIDLHIDFNTIFIRNSYKEILPTNNLESSKTELVPYDEIEDSNYTSLIKNNEINQYFFDIFKNTCRPDIYIAMEKGLYPIYDIKQKNAIHLKNISVNSPGILGFLGALDPLTASYCRLKEEDRKKILFSSQLSEQLLKNMEHMISLDEKLNSPNVTPQMKIYIQNMLDALMMKQAQLVKQLNIKEISFDIIA